MEDSQNNLDHEQFVALLARHHSALLGYVYSLVANWQDAQDVLQHTSIILWRKFEEFDPTTDFMSWATRVAFYESKNFIRQAGRDRHYFSEKLMSAIAEERQAEIPVITQRAHALELCLNKLPEKDQELIVQIYKRKNQVGDLASKAGVAAQSMYNRLYRLRNKLAHCMQDAMKKEVQS